MIINNVIFKRDATLNTRLPKEVKQKLEVLVNRKNKTKSEYILELILQELTKEGIIVQATADNHQIPNRHA